MIISLQQLSLAPLQPYNTTEHMFADGLAAPVPHGPGATP